MKHLFLLLTRSKTTALVFALLWTFVILAACFMPGNDVPRLAIPFMDKLVHCVFFAGGYFLWACYWRPVGRVAVWSLLFGCVLLGVGVEVVQGSGWVRNRSFEWADVVADGIGALLGLAIYCGFCNKVRRGR